MPPLSSGGGSDAARRQRLGDLAQACCAGAPRRLDVGTHVGRMLAELCLGPEQLRRRRRQSSSFFCGAVVCPFATKSSYALTRIRQGPLCPYW